MPFILYFTVYIILSYVLAYLILHDLNEENVYYNLHVTDKTEILGSRIIQASKWKREDLIFYYTLQNHPMSIGDISS